MSLRTAAVDSVKWTGISSAAIALVSMLRFVILARIMPPSVFGIFGMISVVIGLVEVFADLGISTALIQRKNNTRNQLSSLYWFNVFTGGALFLILQAATPLVIAFYREPLIREPYFWLTFSFLILPFGLQFSVLMQKELNFKQLTFIDLAALAVEFVLTIALAFLNFGVMAIVWGGLAGKTVRTILFMVNGWKDWHPDFHLAFRDLKGYLSFGLFETGRRVLIYFSSNVDYLIIGRVLGSEILGIYTLAYQLVVQPASRINPMMSRVTLPLFSKIQDDDERLAAGYLKVISLVSFLIFPILAGLASLAPIYVPLFWGDRWLAAIPLIQILAIMAALRVPGNSIGSIISAKGRADIGFWYNLGVVLANIIGFAAVVRMGVLYIAIVQVVLHIVYCFAILHILKKQIAIPMRSSLQPVLHPAFFSVIMVAVLGPLVMVFPHLQQGRIVQMLILTLVGTLIYGGLYYCFQRGFLRELHSLVVEMLARKRIRNSALE